MRKPVIPPVINDPERLARALFRKSGRARRLAAGEGSGRPEASKGGLSRGGGRQGPPSRD